MSGLFVVKRHFFLSDQTVSLALDGLMLSLLKETEGIRNRLIKMTLHL